MPSEPSTPHDVAAGLAANGYLADEGLVTAVFLALSLHRPLFLEGEAGVGKTELAKTIARWQGTELIRLQCYEGIDAAQAVYDWDYSRQLLHLRTVEATGEATSIGAEKLEGQLYSERFLIRRALLQAIDQHTGVSPVLLIDEIDRADEPFEAFLLEYLGEYQVTIPELGTITADSTPVTILTSNRTRELNDAVKRRCLYHWLDYPDRDRELAIISAQVPGASEKLAQQVADVVTRLRNQPFSNAFQRCPLPTRLKPLCASNAMLATAAKAPLLCCVRVCGCRGAIMASVVVRW
mgnify:CR=1 FL=1